MKRIIFLALAAVAVLSGCIAYPVGYGGGGGERGGYHGQDRHGDDRHRRDDGR